MQVSQEISVTCCVLGLNSQLPEALFLNLWSILMGAEACNSWEPVDKPAVKTGVSFPLLTLQGCVSNCATIQSRHNASRGSSSLTSFSSPAPGAFRTLPSAQWHMFGVCRYYISLWASSSTDNCLETLCVIFCLCFLGIQSSSMYSYHAIILSTPFAHTWGSISLHTYISSPVWDYEDSSFLVWRPPCLDCCSIRQPTQLVCLLLQSRPHPQKASITWLLRMRKYNHLFCACTTMTKQGC